MSMELGKFDVARYLATLPLFSALSREERERLASGCQLQRMTRGDMVFSTGEPCEAFHVVVTGQVRLYVASPTGQEKVIELVSAGQSFAEALMFLDKTYILNAQSLTDTLLIRVSKDAVCREITRDPGFAMHMLAGISRRLHGLVRDVEGYAMQSGLQRLIGYLLRDVLDENSTGAGEVTVSLPVSKATIASRLSLTPEYLSRVLHELESKGLIAMDKRDIRILDVQRLADYDTH
jgi:CRP-like cAMP-binding protein